MPLPRITLLSAIILLATIHTGFAQFVETPVDKGAKLGQPVTQKLKVGVIIKSEGGPCHGILATVPVPIDWPEQKVEIVEEDISHTVPNVRYRTTSGCLKQMVIEVPNLSNGQEAKAIITFEVSHAPQLPPSDTSIYKIPKKLDRLTTVHLNASPQIESRHSQIIALAKQIVAEKETAWQQVEAIYNWVQKNIQLQAGDLKGAARALNDKNGDAEDLVSLFIALCRASKIPARTVWVPQHCYAEFYLVDDDNKGHWFACDLKEVRPFGTVDETRPILLKGDSFKDPERPTERMRFVSEFIKGAGGGGKPKVTFIRETAGQ